MGSNPIARSECPLTKRRTSASWFFLPGASVCRWMWYNPPAGQPSVAGVPLPIVLESGK
jgi:hypothetical protein